MFVWVMTTARADCLRVELATAEEVPSGIMRMGGMVKVVLWWGVSLRLFDVSLTPCFLVSVTGL